MIIPEYTCEYGDVTKFLKFLPITAEEDYPWIKKYIQDMIYHLGRKEYELATISSHIIYMFIVYTFILKKREFDLKKIQSDFSGDKEHLPKSIAEISPCIYVFKPDKGVFEMLKQSSSLKKIHYKIVQIRDNVAHCSGRKYEENDFFDYLTTCIKCLKELSSNILDDFQKTQKFQNALNDTDRENIIKDYLLSFSEISIAFKCDIKEHIRIKLTDMSTWEKFMVDSSLLSHYAPDEYTYSPFEIEINSVSVSENNIQGNFSSDVNFQVGTSNLDEGVSPLYSQTYSIEGAFRHDMGTNEMSLKITSLPK